MKKYPYADLSRFRFVVSVGLDLKNVVTKIEFVTNENYFIDIRASTFTNNKEYTKYLTIKNMEGTKREFFKKYPNADTRRFVFREVEAKDEKPAKVVTYFKIVPDNEYQLVDITSDTFLRTPGFTKYLTNFKERGFGIWFADGTVQPYKKNTNHIEENRFKMYVTDTQYFTANFTPFSITNTLSADYKKNSYLIAIIAAYVSTYVCGISTQHMEFNEDTPGIITSMVRYHLYYQISKFLKDPSKLDRYIARVPNTIKKHKPTTPVWTDTFDQGREEINTWLSEQKDLSKIRNCKYHKNPKGYVTGITYKKITGQSPNDVDDYKMFIAMTTDGLTKIGQKLLQQSIESYVYAVLGAQAKTRWSTSEKEQNLYKRRMCFTQ